MKQSGKEKIVQAMITLMKSKHVDKITITDLVEEAGVNRSTYYYHFYEVSDVIKYMMNLFWEGALSGIRYEKNFTIGNGDYDPHLRDMTIRIFQYILEHRDMFLAIIKSSYKDYFYNHMAELMVEQCFQYDFYYELNGEKTKMTNTEKQYFLWIGGHDLIGALECWSRRGLEESPDELIRQMYDLSGKGLRVTFVVK